MSMMIALLLAGQISISRPSISIPRPSVSVPSVSVPSVSLPSTLNTTRTVTTTPTTTTLTLSERRDQLIMDSQSLLSKARAQLAAMPAAGATIAIPVPGSTPPPSRAEFETQINTTASAYDTMARFSRSDTVGMEGAMDRSSKANTALADIMKKVSDAAPAPAK